MLKYYIGTDPEFMVKLKGEFLYPRLDRDDYVGLRKIGADEFGHCAEIRPDKATSGEDLVLNTMKEMAKLPDVFTYHADNTHEMDKARFIKLVRILGRKDLSESANIYDKEILDDCPADLKARKAGKRLLFCGAHMHISCVDEVSVPVRRGETIANENKEFNVKLPVKTLVFIFDRIIFSLFQDEPGFNIGRYRSPGYYEVKSHGGFEYRSLGASVLTPERMCLIADIMLEVAKNYDSIASAMLVSGKPMATEKINGLVNKLKKTKVHNGCLRKLWVPWQ